MRCRTLHGEALFLLRVRVAVRRNRMPRNARTFEAAPEPVCHQCGCPPGLTHEIAQVAQPGLA